MTQVWVFGGNPEPNEIAAVLAAVPAVLRDVDRREPRPSVCGGWDRVRRGDVDAAARSPLDR